MTGTRFFAASTQSSTTRLCSAWLKVGDSPVVPTGTRPCVPCPTCQSTKSWKPLSSTVPPRNGVIRATIDPWNMGDVLRLKTTADDSPLGERRQLGVRDFAGIYRNLTASGDDLAMRLCLVLPPVCR